jgi:hypothetical protein
MKESAINHEVTFPAHQQTTIVAQPSEGALNFPPSLVTAQRTSILRPGLFAVAPMWTNHLNPSILQSLTQWVTVVTTIQNQAPHFVLPRLRHDLQGWFEQIHLRWRCTAQRGCQRNSLAICHHHPFGSLTFLGASDSSAPFLAGANEPSAKVSSHSRCPVSSNSSMKVRQMKVRHTLSQTSCSCQSRSRRQQVAGEGYCSGKSRQRAPVFKTHKIPSSTRRLSTKRRPPLGEGCSWGSSGSTLRHCCSVNKGCSFLTTASQTNRRL